jgi:flagellar motility protein MotE (MotC chaperone)
MLRATENLAFAQDFGDAPRAGAEAESGDLLLSAIRERETQLRQEELRLAELGRTLQVSEAKLAEQLAAFEIAQRNLEETLAMADGAAERDIAAMTSVYENMEPKDAARIVERMDVGFAAGLLARMRPEVAADVLTGMDADAAYAITLTITSRNAAVPKQ